MKTDVGHNSRVDPGAGHSDALVLGSGESAKQTTGNVSLA